jgi:hypothetical protein
MKFTVGFRQVAKKPPIRLAAVPCAKLRCRRFISHERVAFVPGAIPPDSNRDSNQVTSPTQSIPSTNRRQLAWVVKSGTTGFEPVDDSCASSNLHCIFINCEQFLAANTLHFKDAERQCPAWKDPELQFVIGTWASLSYNHRRTMIALAGGEPAPS